MIFTLLALFIPVNILLVFLLLIVFSGPLYNFFMRRYKISEGYYILLTSIVIALVISFVNMLLVIAWILGLF